MTERRACFFVSLERSSLISRTSCRISLRSSSLKASSLVSYDAEGLAEDAASVADFARRGGLTAHAAAALIRVDKDR